MSKQVEVRLVDRERDIVRCNLCNKEMNLINYDKHYDRCLMISTLIPILRERGENVDYEILSGYDSNVLERIILKYLPFKKELFDGKIRSNNGTN